MSWERRRNGRLYLYRARRIGRKVVKQYVGRGRQAEDVARRDAAKRAERAARHREELELRQQCVAASGMLAAVSRVCDGVTLVVRAAPLHHHQIANVLDLVLL